MVQKALSLGYLLNNIPGVKEGRKEEVSSLHGNGIPGSNLLLLLHLSRQLSTERMWTIRLQAPGPVQVLGRLLALNG